MRGRHMPGRMLSHLGGKKQSVLLTLFILLPSTTPKHTTSNIVSIYQCCRTWVKNKPSSPCLLQNRSNGRDCCNPETKEGPIVCEMLSTKQICHFIFLHYFPPNLTDRCLPQYQITVHDQIAVKAVKSCKTLTTPHMALSHPWNFFLHSAF